MKKLRFYATGFAAIASILLTSCNRDDTPVDENTEDYTTNLTNITNNVIVANYSTLSQKAAATATAANALTIGDDAKLNAVKAAWVEMRIYWENSETNLFGPAGDDYLGVDGNIDSWPIDLQFVQDVLDGTTPITASYVSSLDSNAKGFHALEYLLWGIDGQKTASQLTAREIEYVKATAQYIANQTSGLYDAWRPGGSNFAKNFTNASSGIYQSQINALEQLVDGMIDIANEVGAGKIEDPLNGNNGSFSLEDEESRFSNNSKADFADNIRGILYLYTGNYNNQTGLGISEIVEAKNPTLNTKVVNAISDAVNGIESIPGTFTQAIQTNRPAVVSAQNKVITLRTILESELKPFVQSL